MPPSLRCMAAGLLVLAVFTGCISDDGGDDESHGQITRPADIGLPLDNADSVAAFDVADNLLLNWFFREDIERALGQIYPDVRESWRSLLEDTEIEGDCSLVQVEGSTPDPSSTVTARYAISGCKVTPPGGKTAVYIELTMSRSEDRFWVNQIEFLR
jgi:hypothetical protein